MGESRLSSKLFNFTIFLFLLSACLSSLFFIKGFLKSKQIITDKTKNRYSLLKTEFHDNSVIQSYIKPNLYRKFMYQQVHWMVIDGFSSYMVNSMPNTSIFHIIRIKSISL